MADKHMIWVPGAPGYALKKTIDAPAFLKDAITVTAFCYPCAESDGQQTLTRDPHVACACPVLVDAALSISLLGGATPKLETNALDMLRSLHDVIMVRTLLPVTFRDMVMSGRLPFEAHLPEGIAGLAVLDDSFV
ncbi:hypothetical protein EPH_0011970 [Eimeria praecox]|uniref:Uncharacterized protein n=1 Tax=Eimeria praecox TaxID=51316 RepID=U6GU19_9EIME|nr:hypothetical protein EPH_0011970 [Eimeria praecox]